MSSNLALIISCIASFIVFAESQQICSTSNECEKGCCYQGSCTTDKFTCQLLEKINKYERSCTRNQDCFPGCCIDYKCKAWSSSSLECVDKDACTKNSDCLSACCKNGKCQEVPCLTIPTINFDDILDKCTTSNDCFQSSKSCCVSGRCRACSHKNSHNDYNDRNDYNDYNDYSGSSSSSSSGAGTGVSIGIGVVIFIVVVIFKIAFCYYRINRRRVVVVRRRCVQTRVAIVQNDELQREHERIENETSGPGCSPPPYSPTTSETDTRYTGQNQDQIEGETNTSESYGVPQGSPMVPPPAYYPNPAAYQSENTTQPDQIHTGSMIGNIEEINGVPQGSAPPPIYSPNPNENTTGQPDPKRSGYQ